MPRSPKAAPLAVERFKLLIDQLGSEAGKPHRGWQVEVARRLGIDPSIISKVLADDSGYVLGEETVQRVCKNLRLSPAYFTRRTAYRKPGYRRFLVGAERPAMPRRTTKDTPFRRLADTAHRFQTKLTKDELTPEEVYELATALLDLPAVQAARRICERPPSKEPRRIMEESREFIEALVQERPPRTKPDLPPKNRRARRTA